MTMSGKERAGWDVWDKLRHTMGKVAAAQPKPPERPWYQHPKAPTPEEVAKQRPPQPRPKPRTAPPVPPNKGDQKWWQDKRIPRQWQEQTTPPPKGRDGTNAYNDPADKERQLRGAYAAGLNGDAGAAQSFPRGSEFERAYQQGLRQRQMSRVGAGA